MLMAVGAGYAVDTIVHSFWESDVPCWASRRAHPSSEIPTFYVKYWHGLTDNIDMYVLRLQFVVKVTSWFLVFGTAIFAVRGFARLMELAPFVFSRSW